MATFGNKFCMLVKKTLLICPLNYVLFCYAQITMSCTASIRGGICSYTPFQDECFSKIFQFPYIFWKFSSMFIIPISKGVCVVVISEFEITFHCTIVDFVIIIYKYFCFVIEALCFRQHPSKGQVSILGRRSSIFVSMVIFNISFLNKTMIFPLFYQVQDHWSY